MMFLSIVFYDRFLLIVFLMIAFFDDRLFFVDHFFDDRVLVGGFFVDDRFSVTVFC